MKQNTAELTGKPAVFWFLNSDLDNNELRSQLRTMHEHGIGGTFMHWILGGPGYMSETWLRALDVIIEESGKLGMNAWLYDEAWCPSCYAGGIILAERPDLQAKTLWSKQIDVSSRNKITFNFDLMKVLSVVALPLKDGIPQLDNPVDISSYIGPCAEAQEKPYRHDWGYYPFIKPHLHWRSAIKGTMKWQLQWEAPAGNDWRVYVFCQREMLQWDGFNRLDVLHPESIQYFLKETHEKYAQRYSKYFGNIIPGIMTDEYRFLPACWTEKFPQHYKRSYNKDLIKVLPALVDDSIPESRIVKANYHRLVSDLFIKNYTLPMKDWCDRHNLILTGHISPEEHATNEIKFAGNAARHIKYFDMPGADIIIPKIGNREYSVLNLSPHLAASVAHQEGKSRVFIEAGACCNENLSLELYKYIIDWLMVHGINCFDLHAFSYKLAGYSKFLAGQSMGTYGNLITNFQVLSNYIEERCNILTEFRPDAKIALLKPMAALRASSGIYELEKEGEFIDKALTEIAMSLIENHIDFDLLDEDGAADWIVDGKSLVVGKAAYDMVIIPECGLLADYAHNKIAEFANKGGYAIAHKSIPEIISAEKISSCNDSDFISLNTPEEIAEFAENNLEDWLWISGENAKNVQVFKGINKSGEKLCFMLNICDFPVTIWLESGGVKNSVRLESHETKIIHLPFTNITKDKKVSEFINLDSTWQLKSEKQNHIPLTAGMEIIVEDGVVIDCLICDKVNLESLKESFIINKSSPEWEKAFDTEFYSLGNLAVPITKSFKAGTNIIDFDDEEMPTILLTGDFSAFINEKDQVILKKTVTLSKSVSRIEAGFPYLQGKLVFKAQFSLSTPIKNAELRFKGRKGSIEVCIDGDLKGIVAWKPDTVRITELPAGQHTLTLEVVGDGIGVMREGYFDAGCTALELVFEPNPVGLKGKVLNHNKNKFNSKYLYQAKEKEKTKEPFAVLHNT